MKSEPSTFSVDDLAACARQTTFWDGVRNYQARNMLRDEFKAGDLAFMYHSSCDEPGVVGVVEIVRAGYPDPTQFDKKHDHYDPGSKADAPRWYGVDVRLRQRLSRVIGLDELRSHPALKEFRLLQRGNRLSVMPVSASHWRCIMGLEKKVR